MARERVASIRVGFAEMRGHESIREGFAEGRGTRMTGPIRETFSRKPWAPYREGVSRFATRPARAGAASEVVPSVCEDA